MLEPTLPRNQFIGRPEEVLPKTVARCRTAEDVAEALKIAQANDWEFAIRGGGHSNAGYSSSRDLVIDMSPATEISTNGTRVTIGAGVRTGELARVLAPRERLVPAGSCPSVGLVGVALGGGFGSHGRRHGLTCDHLVEAEVVLADGIIVSTDDEPDLLWALRGAGGGNFGVVTKAVFETVPSTPRTHVRLTWPWRHAKTLIQQWPWDAPDDVSLELILWGSDYLDEEPQITLIGTVPDERALDRIGVEPATKQIVHLNAVDAALRHPTPADAAALDPVAIPLTTDRPGMCTARTEFFDEEIPPTAIDDLLRTFVTGRVHGELREVAFTPWGGAYAHKAAEAAFAHRTPKFLVKHTVLVGPVGAARRGHEALAWLDMSWSTLHPHGTGRCYANFPDPNLPDPLTSYYGANLDRLKALKRRYDPRNVFHFAQSVKID
ncbi:hypothetical protein Lesp02_59600 [Lentzea sp. NBRC 105346]|uniref:FAD-binding oxidoreductase n=1 Tax=Lentzea sp. NBRC 105346 TaxID=3032205 RepID=UPI0024A2BACF|nr:FAD-binding oxidoreductase [Lentzea sp. NBRC 105346]GLZ33772.1 hypothetical protein Lesp02_59600 [Lentzea sp. NBRC 105346]